MLQFQCMLEKLWRDLLTLSTTFYDLSVSRNLFSKADMRQFGASVTDGLNSEFSLLIFKHFQISSDIKSQIKILYHSIVAVGQRWYSFGWESQTLETGFLAIWFVPFWSVSKFGSKAGSFPIIANLWMIFRIMLGAGLIKIRGDECWRDLTCMGSGFKLHVFMPLTLLRQSGVHSSVSNRPSF